MKRLPLITIFLFIQLFSHSQEKKNEAQLNISTGPAVPVGQFANKDIYNDKAGLASIGGVLDISYLLPYRRKAGIIFSLHGQINPVARRSMAESFSQAQFVYGFSSGPFIPTDPTQLPTTTFPNWKFNWSAWTLGSLMAGVYSELKTHSAKMSITPKAMIGVVYAVSPRINGSSVTYTAMAHATQSAESGFGFSYSLGSNLKFKVNKKLNFITGVEFFGTNRIKFKDVIASVTLIKHMNNPPMTTSTQSTVVTNGKQSITSINLVAGFSFRL